MNELIGRVFNFEKTNFPNRSELFNKLTTDGQSPQAMIISCADSRIVPEQIMEADPGDLFVCRNAGNIVPPYVTQNGGVSSTIEYAVAALGVTDIIVCGHSGCGAMTALAGDPADLDPMPSVAAWLKHASAARHIVDGCNPELSGDDRVREVSLANVEAQLTNLRTHPTVATAIARGEMTLHGWFVDIHEGQVLGLDGRTGEFRPLRADEDLPVALPARRPAIAEPAE
ncbi:MULTISPECIES: carbonic anhydrase [Croceicoccus]|uniref:carbonic anhydrase n=1 Tax=Croceicoccus TaxID=1295327 RepID=UPI001923117D|nr:MULTISPECIES: carbonic anhydrase [Croceicoccus]QQN73113.1 carbonic anhydrase [Croceicoccus sp. YJ47]